MAKSAGRIGAGGGCLPGQRKGAAGCGHAHGYMHGRKSGMTKKMTGSGKGSHMGTRPSKKI